uniref:Uncharacterized protein n=1 Tax=Anguilla anguilla TaxID=7936 RepID=A0A0E9QWZ9_ANGAN
MLMKHRGCFPLACFILLCFPLLADNPKDLM